MKVSTWVLCLVFCSCTKHDKVYYPDGKIKGIVETGRNGKGTVYEYYQNGNLKTKGELLNGKLHGRQEYYYENGNLNLVINATNNVREGEYSAYSSDGKLASRGTYIHGGKRQARVYYPNGNIHEFHLFNSEEKPVYLIKYDSTGKRDFSMVVPLLESKSDTVTIGDQYRLTIRFGIPMHGDIEVYAGTMKVPNEEFHVTDTLRKTDPDEYKFEYVTTPDKPGLMPLRFQFQHKTDEADTTSVDEQIVKRTILVLDKPNS